MCYLIAKDRDAHGCYALKTTHGKHLAELKNEPNQAVGYRGVQLVTISRPTAYGEYAPYHFVDTEQEFRSLVKGLRPCKSTEGGITMSSALDTIIKREIKKIREDERQRIAISLKEDGMSIEEIAKIFKCQVDVVEKWLTPSAV